MNNLPPDIDTLILGAGMAGLCCAHDLTEAGLEVAVIDKGRGMGGRLAGRRIGEATFDHGAQYFTARHPRFKQLVEDWSGQGLVREWYRFVPGQPSASIRWCGVPAMTAMAKQLGANLPVHLKTQALSIHAWADGWRVKLAGGEEMLCRNLVLTAPVPQSLALLKAGGVTIESSVLKGLEELVYDPCIAVMAVLDRPSGLADMGALRPAEGPIQWIADNRMKGISALPALTLHATPEFSKTHWDMDRQQAGELLLVELAKYVDAEVIEFQVHGWKFSQPVNPHDQACVVAKRQPLLVLAGDAFQGPRVEGAACSGWAAATEVLGARE